MLLLVLVVLGLSRAMAFRRWRAAPSVTLDGPLVDAPPADPLAALLDEGPRS